jgi:hypothetical protein
MQPVHRTHRRRLRRACGVFVPLAVAVVAAFTSGCKDTPSGLLFPPGQTHVSDFTSVYLAGTFTSWDASRFTPSLSMKLVQDYVWQQTITLPAGQIGFKFVVGLKGSDWDAFTHSGQSGLTGSLTRVTGGVGNEIVTTIPTAGDWVFTFYERGPTGTEGPTYSVSKKTQYAGAIEGTVEFSDIASPPYPQATVTARRAGTGGDTTVAAVTVSDTLTGAFVLSGLQDGPYSVTIARQGYRDSVVTGVQIVSEGRVSLGRVRIERGALLSAWASMYLTGDFTTPTWTPNDPSQAMTLVADYTWQATVHAPARAIHWKFVTDGAWDNDYGTTTAQNGLTGPTTLVGGVGTDLAATIPSDGNYTFTLHERGYQGNDAQAWYEITPAPSPHASARR